MSYVIARLSDDGQDWETLQVFKSYEAADRGLDALAGTRPVASARSGFIAVAITV